MQEPICKLLVDHEEVSFTASGSTEGKIFCSTGWQSEPLLEV